MTLTEQWKKGKLPDGNYWVMLDVYEDDNPELSTVQMSENKPIGWFEESVKKILDKIPTYKEYQKLLSDQLAKQEGEEIIAELEHKNLLLKVANAELREQLEILSRAIDNYKKL